VTLESVLEEECTGNGNLQYILASYRADAAIVAEPIGAGITTSQVGVLWFDVRVAGVPGHAGEERRGSNAIEQRYAVVRALRGLETELTSLPRRRGNAREFLAEAPWPDPSGRTSEGRPSVVTRGRSPGPHESR
jgi:acetylornithine deacetylase/succinyl-diaminopimelate desuccinylase-like protein